MYLNLFLFLYVSVQWMFILLTAIFTIVSVTKEVNIKLVLQEAIWQTTVVLIIPFLPVTFISAHHILSVQYAMHTHIIYGILTIVIVNM